MAFTGFLVLLVLGTGEGLGSAVPGAGGSRAGSRAGGEVLRQGEWSRIPFKVRRYQSQRHPGSRDIVASPVLAPGLVVPRKAGTWGLRLSNCSPSAVSEGLGQGLGCAGDQPEQAVPGACSLECRCVPVSARTPGSPPVPAAPAGNLPGSCLYWTPARPGRSRGRGSTPGCHPQQGGLYWVVCLSLQHVRDTPGWRRCLQGWA